ncbi:MAG: 4'-phosphopantetheinyl transferase superfamily protein [Acidimicrobiaceae bacterium]|nr:4'-phosphopantetheinyl transferase superfamily protein [Acidimicrobiaceae bacterium]
MVMPAGAKRSELFPPSVALAEADASDLGVLSPVEEEEVKGATPRRQEEFRAGRAAARAALAALGYPDAVLPRVGRRPLWPSGFVGSISHCPGLCVAAAARERDVEAIGLDVEVRRRVRPRLHDKVCTPAEQAWMAASGHSEETATLLFSAKEATYKCLNPLTGARLAFGDVEVAVDLEAGTFVAAISAAAPPNLSRLVGRFAFEDDHLLTGVAVPARRAP